MMSQCNLATINSTHPHHDIVLVNFITRLRNRIKKKTNDIISDVYIIILLVARGDVVVAVNPWKPDVLICKRIIAVVSDNKSGHHELLYNHNIIM